MRALILAAALLALAACRSHGQVDNTENVDDNLTAENIVSNDVTAIDAVTGDASNMAAESDINDIGAAPTGNNGNMSSATKPTPKRPAASLPTEPTTANTVAPASNSTTNSAD